MMDGRNSDLEMVLIINDYHFGAGNKKKKNTEGGGLRCGLLIGFSLICRGW